MTETIIQPPVREKLELEGRILNLASGEFGIVNSQVKAIIAASLDECALIFIRNKNLKLESNSDEPIAAGVHYKSPELNKGRIKQFYRELLKDGVPPEITIVWGRSIHPDNKTAVLEEIGNLKIDEYQEVNNAAQGALILNTGKVLSEIPQWISQEIKDFYLKKL